MALGAPGMHSSDDARTATSAYTTTPHRSAGRISTISEDANGEDPAAIRRAGAEAELLKGASTLLRLLEQYGTALPTRPKCVELGHRLTSTFQWKLPRFGWRLRNYGHRPTC